MRNKTLTRIIIATLLCALLVNAGRATRVFALAQPIDVIEPIYDTEIIALKDYVEQNLDNPQLDIFFLLGGALAVAQLGAQDAMLESPYPNETSVKEWLINCGIQLYNAVIGLVPSGDYYINIPILGQPETATKGIPRSMIKGIVAHLMGDAVVARNYSSVDDFLDDDDRPDVPLSRDAQVSINAIWQLQGGPFKWQFDSKPFETQGTYKSIDLTIPNQNSYDNWVNGNKTMRVNYPNQAIFNGWSNVVYKSSVFNTYHNLFLDESTFTFYLCDDSGNRYINYNSSIYCERAYLLNGTFTTGSGTFDCPYLSPVNFNSGNYSTYVEAVQAYFNQQIRTYSTYGFFDFIDHVYVGTNWINKNEIFNLTGLNIAEDMNPYYRSPDTDVFFDIKDLIENIVNKTSIWDFFLDHLFDIDGNLIIPNFPTFSVDLTPITDLMSPPIPVNLNDFALYADNDYLEEIRDRSEKFGETIGQYFVFWHNADPVTVYVIFGSVIIILLGAFVGKLGHS